jgi:hypothetical protein
VAVGVDHGVDAVAQVEFGQDPGDVGLDGFVSDVEAATDLDVAVVGGALWPKRKMAWSSASRIRKVTGHRPGGRPPSFPIGVLRCPGRS